MEEKRYELRILPLFEEKLQETADYIAFRLRNPIAAEAFEPYRSKKDRKYVYYAIPVKNYLVFYVVIGHVMEVRTLVYGRRDLTKII